MTKQTELLSCPNCGFMHGKDLNQYRTYVCKCPRCVKWRMNCMAYQKAQRRKVKEGYENNRQI